MVTRIAHTTDFSPESARAFEHALRLALALRARLDILHVRDPDAGEEGWRSFPGVRDVLIRWGLLEPGATPADIETRLGLHVSKIEIRHGGPIAGIEAFLERHQPGLLVVATHGRLGLSRLIMGSVSQELIQRTEINTLLIGPKGRGFVDPETGALSLSRVLLPVVADPSPAAAAGTLLSMFAAAGLTLDGISALTAGPALPPAVLADGRTLPVEAADGAAVETILRIAAERRCDLIAMPTNGRHGVLQALRGSTTARVLADATCPVLSIPMFGG